MPLTQNHSSTLCAMSTKTLDLDTRQLSSDRAASGRKSEGSSQGGCVLLGRACVPIMVFEHVAEDFEAALVHHAKHALHQLSDRPRVEVCRNDRHTQPIWHCGIIWDPANHARAAFRTCALNSGCGDRLNTRLQTCGRCERVRTMGQTRGDA